ncbi:MAG: hypothetical protein WA061_02395 [Microgenomates group bacterium]
MYFPTFGINTTILFFIKLYAGKIVVPLSDDFGKLKDSSPIELKRRVFVISRAPLREATGTSFGVHKTKSGISFFKK